MADFINTVDEIGQQETIKRILEGTITEFKDNRLDTISFGAFAYCDKLVEVDLPNVSQIGDYAFYHCESLKRMRFNIQSLGQNYGGEGTFNDCYSLEELDFSPENLPSNWSQTNIAPNFTAGSAYNHFYNCVCLVRVINAPSFLNNVFFNAGRFLSTNNIGTSNSAAYTKSGIQYTRFETIELNGDILQYGNTYAFFFRRLVLTKQLSEVPSLPTSFNSIFSFSPFALSNRGNAFIYVPDDLVDSFKVATNWSVVAEKIVPLSSYNQNIEADQNFNEYISDSWATIKQNIDNNNYSQYLNKKKYLLVPKYGWCYMVCIKQDGDELADGTGNAKTTWFCEDCIGITRRMNPSMVYGTVGTGSIGGYANSEIKGVMDDIYEVLNAEDSELHNIITPIKKYTHVFNVDGTGSSTRNHDVESTEYVWLASYREMFGTSSTIYETKGVTYSDYFTNRASRIKYICSGAYSWWLRSSNTYDNDFQMVSSSGYSNNNSADYSCGIAFGFCI